MPPSAAAAPSSYDTTCASAPASSSPPRGTSSCNAIWLAIVPDGQNSAASCPNGAATSASSAFTVGSSPKTSSPTSASAIAARIAGVGRVTVSERRSTVAPAPPSGGIAVSRSATEHLRHQEGQLETLLGVQPRVAGRLVPVGQIEILDPLRPAQALGDILTGQFDVDAARVCAQPAVHLEVAEHHVDDPVEVAGLVAVAGLVRVAVHRVALPDHLGPGRGHL